MDLTLVRSISKSFIFKNSLWSIPKYSFCSSNYFIISFDCIWSNIKTNPSIINSFFLCPMNYLCVFTYFISTYVINWKMNFYSFAFSLLHNLFNLISSLLIKQRRSNTSSIQNFIESKCHASSYDHFIDYVK